ncbi:hypothetical protein AVEN_242526-1 [Araneus ventricosus]|uniref:Uncharacterized protein n=1 Tax=Araneus ventricosus TaxID=182803 RepID=A0A4Y2P343_ARAVE|nr:hypothetical protein AVEN_242526-1 [Araneus ventricosus]
MRCVLFLVFVSFIAVVSSSSGCSEYQLPCDDGECIDVGTWCDTREDCSDGSDEKYCKKSGIFNKDPNKCRSTYFKCSDGPCIPLAGLCNGYDECGDASDEQKCEQESSPKSDGTYPHFKPVTSPLETRTTPTTSTTTTRATPHQTFVKLDSHATHFSDYNLQRETARKWLLSQRDNDFGWGDETPRAITALYLADVQRPMRKNESDMLMVKQLEVQLSLDMAR